MDVKYFHRAAHTHYRDKASWNAYDIFVPYRVHLPPGVHKIADKRTDGFDGVWIPAWVWVPTEEAVKARLTDESA